MAVEYEDIDLGQVSEVTKEEFDLAKLEAEGWVSEIVVGGDLINQFNVCAQLIDEEYDADKKPFVSFKVNDKLVEPTFGYSEEDEAYVYDLFMDLPTGTSIKVYHNPSLASKTNMHIYINYDDGSEEYIECRTILDICKCPKTLGGLLTDNEVRCYSLPQTIQTISLGTCLDITAHIPPNVRLVEIIPAYVETDEVDEYGYTIWKKVDLEVHLDGLPEELWFGGDTEAYPDNIYKVYVPYHLLEEAKLKFPENADVIDALVPASKVTEESKLYRHILDFDFVDNANVNQWVEEGEELTQIYASVSFISNKKYLLDADYGEADENAPWDIQGQEDNVITLNDSIMRILGGGMSAIIYLSSGEIIPASISEHDKHCIVFALSDGRFFQIELTEDYDVPMSCTMMDFVSELK